MRTSNNHTNPPSWLLFILLLPFLFLTGCGSSEITMEKLVKKGGVYYLLDTDQPYSGPVRNYFPTRKGEEPRLWQEGSMSMGRKDGEWIKYKWTGERVVYSYANGRLHGTTEHYDRYDNLTRSTVYKRGRRHGFDITYNPRTGDKKKQLYYVNGSLHRPPAKKDRRLEPTSGVTNIQNM